jgi:lipopolysaccharide/colanic/teichoic acid biosynthesis glycosyltransferase
MSGKINPFCTAKKLAFHVYWAGQGNLEMLGAECYEGIAEKSLENARKSLKEICVSGNIPTVIFIDFSIDINALQTFTDFLKSNSKLASVPVILNVRNLTKEQLSSDNLRKMVDEMLDFKINLVAIQEKVYFLKKVKESLIEKKSSIKPEYNSASVYNNYHFAKRVLDILLASLFLILFSPVFLIIAFAVKFESRGPVFYNSYRAGRGYRIFKFYKFRTMKVGAERMLNSIAHLNKYNNFGHAPVFFKIDNDPRITRVGQFLRNSGLDELPQLINVLKGDMSIVGNRPLPLYEASSLTTDEWAERFAAPSGITGLWQVSSRNAEDFTCFERINTDIRYASDNNLLLDLRILLKTPIVLIKGFLFWRK